MNQIVLERLRPHRAWLGFFAAILGPFIALGIRFAIGSVLTGFPFVTFFPAVLIAAFLGSWSAGLIATVLSGALADYYLLEPSGSIWPAGPSEWIGMGFFVLVCATMVALIEALNTTLDRLAAVGKQQRDTNRLLEQRVIERTRKLEEANVRLQAEIAAREAAEAQVRQSQKMDAIGQLTGGIAHDFNNMLAIIIGSLDMARRRLGRGENNIMLSLDNALDGANRAATLTRRLLAFSRQQPLDPVVTDLNALVKSMAELLKRTLGETIKLECVLAGGLWRTCVDPGQLESVILNLAVNARDAMPEGGRLTIETFNGHLDDAYAATHSEVRPGQYVVVAVTDTGIGMPPEVAARAFDPFFTTKGVGKGTGLGLSQVYGFVKQSNGHVQLYSEPDHGTTVKVYLRRDTSTDQVRGETGARAAVPAVPRGRSDEIVLVVEDEEHVRRTSVEALRELGYTVRHAGSAEEALAVLEEQPGVRLLFTDVVMPGMTGNKLANVATGRNPSLKVLFTTGYTPNAIVHKGVVDPGVQLLSKPFALDQLARKVRNVLDRA